MEESINTNLSDYTLDELFALFDINITRDTTYEMLKTELEDSATKYKTLFKNNAKLGIILSLCILFGINLPNKPIINLSKSHICINNINNKFAITNGINTKNKSNAFI